MITVKLDGQYDSYESVIEAIRKEIARVEVLKKADLYEKLCALSSQYGYKEVDQLLTDLIRLFQPDVYAKLTAKPEEKVAPVSRSKSSRGAGKQKKARTARTVMTPELHAQVTAALATGLTKAQVMEQFGISRTTARRIHHRATTGQEPAF